MTTSMTVTTSIHPQRLARTVGVLYLALAAIGPIAFLFGKAELVADGDALSTAANIAANLGIFRLGMTAEAAVFMIEIVTSAILYVLFRPVSPHWALAAMLARFGQAVVLARQWASRSWAGIEI